MTLLQELKIFIKSIAPWIYSLIAFSIFFSLFGLHKTVIYGKSLILPTLSQESFSVQAFKIIERDFVPAGVQLIVTNPWSGFIVQLELVVVLALIATFPFLMYKIMRYSAPAFFQHERKAILKAVTMFTALFIIGGLFAYYFMIPLTFKFMYPFAASLGVVTFFSLDAFISWTISILVTTGVLFLLPIFMLVLSSLRIVNPDFWRKNRKFALLYLLIFSAVITPDRTGVTMVLLFAPLSVLYLGGSALAGRKGSGPLK